MAYHKGFSTILIIFCHIYANFGAPNNDLEIRNEVNNDDVVQSDVQVPNYLPRGLSGRDGKTGPRGFRDEPGAAEGSGGSVYTRWGRKSCRRGTTLLYAGVMGGSYYSYGGGSNYLCMPLDPTYDKTVNGNQGYSYVYGIEYEMGAHASLFPKNLHDHDAVCAVCFAESRGSQVMIPARNVCPEGWTREYTGYLMSTHISYKRSEFICVDGAPEARQGTRANLNGGLLYVVEGRCGSLPCLPYKQGAELTCAVCTK
ncbi:Hypothetical predicted protein [Paramuricea clavata]|uniref:Uncharacterized protein n=1 Tax=Paramuricea clavata TaxID=317549 RepID=A0A6S7GAM7_PARCT|nr:Hypothetical predicted protein [Paramuricea clavata]